MRVAAAFCSLGLLISSLQLAGCRQRIDSFGVNFELERKTLSNGLTVILVEDHTVPIVSYQTWFRVGSVDERPGLTGISHLFEHLMFKGTEKYGPKRFFEELEAKGSEVNAYTTRDYTVYYETVVPKLLEKVIDMESDRMVNLKLDQAVLDTERSVVFEERRLRSDNTPEGRMHEALWALAYSRHPYQWPVIGYASDLATITVENLLAWYRAHYQPANAAIVVVGDFNAEETFQLIRKYYGKLPSAPRPRRDIPEEPEQDAERRLVLRDAVTSERFAHAYHITSAIEDDSYALDVLANILFEGTRSRAYHRLAEELDIVSGIGGSSYTPAYPGLFMVSGTMKGPLKSALAEAELETLISEVQTKGVTEEEIRIAVRQLTVQLIDSVRTPKGLGQLIGTVQTVFGDPQRFARDLNKYLGITTADVQRVARKYLTPNNRSIITLEPEKPGKASGSKSKKGATP